MSTSTTAGRRADYGPRQAPKSLGMSPSQFTTGIELGLIPGPDVDAKRWSHEVVEDVRARLDEVTAAIEAHRAEVVAAFRARAAAAEAAERARLRSGDGYPIGAGRAAERVAARLGVEISRGDIEALAQSGKLQAVEEYKGHDLYGLLDLDALTADDVAAAAADHRAWWESTISPRAAADMLGWTEVELSNVAYRREIKRGRGDRYDRTDIAALADDEDLAEAIASARTLGPQQAAEHLEIRPADFRYLTDAGLITPVAHVSKPVGRWSEVSVPLYRVGDLDDLTDHPDIDWEAVRAAKPGEPSPLREIMPRRPDRADVVRRFARDLARDHPGIDVWLSYFRPTQTWYLDWTEVDAAPTRSMLAERLAADPTMRDHRDRFKFGTNAGDVVRWARAMLAPEGGVIIDTETTDLFGAIVEIAAVDAHDGRVLLDTLVNPGPDHPIMPGAHEKHGLTAEDLTDAPAWPDVLAQLITVTAGRQLIAYNADYDSTVIAADARRAGCPPQHLAEPDRWHCAMEARTDWLDCGGWLPLDGPHRAVGDCHTTRALLHELANLPPGTEPIQAPGLSGPGRTRI